MKKLTYFILLVLFVSGAGLEAQTGEGTPDSNFSIYKNKLRKSDENLTNEKKNINPKFWLSRAELMMDIFNLHRDHLMQGVQQMHVKLIYREPQEIKTWQEDSIRYEKYIYEKITITFKDGVVESFEELVVLYKTPLDEAYSSLAKAKELDADNKIDKNLKENYDRLKGQFEQLAIEEFLKKEYNTAFEAFAIIAEINKKPIMDGVIDTTLIYYTGMSASRAGMNDKAIEYYEVARSYNYPEPDLYIFLRNNYWEIGDTAKGVEVLVNGFKMFPENQVIVIELINYFLVSGKSEEALEYLRLAQEDDPTNISFLFAEATLYDKQGETEKGLEIYQKCIEMDPTYFNAHYNIGVLYFNIAVEMYKEANNISDPIGYAEAKDEANDVLKKALPYMEKANELAEANTTWTEPVKEINVNETLETLKTLYYRLQMTDKYEAVKAMLEE